MAERALLSLLIVVSAGSAPTPAAWASAGDADRRLLTAAARGDLDAVQEALKEDADVEAHEADGATALMVAALSGHPDVVSALLDRGANPNATNSSGATALMWGVERVDTVEVLVNRGAEVNARTEFGQTPLMIASGSDASSEVARFLIQRGADVNATSKSGFTPLMAAIAGGDADLVELFLKQGANPRAANKAGWTPLHASAAMGDLRTVKRLLAMRVAVNPKVKGFGTTPLMWAAAQGATDVVRRLLRSGAAVNVHETFHGATALIWAASRQPGNPETVRVLLMAGASPRARDEDGDTALRWAVRQGNPEVMRLLGFRGHALSSTSRATPTASTVSPPSPREAVLRSLSLIQPVGPAFVAKAPDGCVSCHHQSLPSMAMAVAREKGLEVDQEILRQQAKATLDELRRQRDRLLVGIGVPDPLDPAYLLLGLAAAKQPADSTSDAMVHYLTLKQAKDGHWRSALHRPPMDDSDFTNTAVSLRALQLFAPVAREQEIDERIQSARRWLASATPKTTEDRVFQLLGLHWAKQEPQTIEGVRAALFAMQRSDGGWSQLPTLPSDAYATGAALVALHESGVPTANPSYRRGLDFLLKSQWPDGSWLVQTRAQPVQEYFDSGFPHGRSQFISIVGTAWATMALAFAVDS